MGERGSAAAAWCEDQRALCRSLSNLRAQIQQAERELDTAARHAVLQADAIKQAERLRDEAIRRYDAIRQIDHRAVQAEARARRLEELLRQAAIGLDGHYVHCPGEKFHGRPEHDCYAIQICETIHALLARIEGKESA